MTPLAFDYPISVAILYYGGKSEDLEDTLEAVKSISDALESCGHVVRTQEVTAKNWLRAVRIPGEVVFNLVEDPMWELYLKVGKRLELLGRAQMGHDMKSFAYVTNKTVVKRKLAKFGIATPAFRVINRRSKISEIRGLEYPLIVKPSGEHAGIGISQDSVVIDQDELRERMDYVFARFKGEVVIEELIEGREMHVTIIGNDRHVVTLPPCEIAFGGEFADNWDVYTYEAKWEKQSWEYWDARASVAKINRDLDIKLEKIAKKTFRAFGCRDIVRLDIRVDKHNRPYVIDLNINPSLNRHEQDATIVSMEEVGWSYEQLIETLVAVCYKRVYGKLPHSIKLVAI